MVKNVAIIGFGFSGLSSALELAGQGGSDVSVTIYEKNAPSGRGYAYATACPLHYLNVPAEKMGAISQDPAHFYKWLKTNEAIWRPLHKNFESIEVTPGWYCPRMIYGKYLESLKNELFSLAEKQETHLQVIESEVNSIEQKDNGLEIICSRGRHLFYDAVIIATGVPWSKKIHASDHPTKRKSYISSLFPAFTDMHQAESLVQKLPENAVVALAGSGLTMLDAVATLTACNYRGQVVVFSHKGLISHPHSVNENSPKELHLRGDDLSLLKLLNTIHLSASKAADWRTVIDGLRPHTQNLWSKISLQDKRKFLERLQGYWNIHRHRAAPETFQFFETMQKKGKLQIEKKFVTHLDVREEGKVIISAQDSIEGAPKRFEANLVINCTGPDFNILKSPNPLIYNILKNELATPDHLQLGLHAASNGRLSKKHQLFAIGSLLVGTFLETTAVPEIRKQAFKIARAILKRDE